MKRVWMAVGLFTVAAFGSAFAEQEVVFHGRQDDIKMIKQNTDETGQFVFARLIYNGRIEGYYKNWYTDYPKCDKLLIQGIKRLTNLNIADDIRAIPISDPDLFKYPFLYSSEVGEMTLSDEDAAILREYLTRGGFWMVDDFWGSFEFGNFEDQVHKIFPNAEIKDIPRDHTIFHIFFDIDKLIQVPSTAYVYNGGHTWETDGWEAECKGVFDDHGRLMIVINHNTDLGDGYENSDLPQYPAYFSTYSFRIAINTFLYSLSH